MEEQLQKDYMKAMKEGNSIEKETIQIIRANIVTAKKNKGTNLTDDEIEEIIDRERKKRQEALGLFEKANRQDLMEKTNKELACISRYLPQTMSDYEVEQYLRKLVEEVGKDKKNFGKIMGMAKAELKTRADGKTLSRILNDILSEE